MKKEPAWLVAFFSFGPLFMLMFGGHLSTPQVPGTTHWLAVTPGILGAFMVAVGLLCLLRIVRRQAAELDSLRREVGVLRGVEHRAV